MATAFVDTTVLVDVLLNKSRTAAAALQRFSETQLPQYAIKEFKAGALYNWVWFHNNLVRLKSFHKALTALQKMSRTPKRYTTATALQALAGAAQQSGFQTLKQLELKYGEKARQDAVLCDMYRFFVYKRILTAWKNRRQVTSKVVDPLSCYKETAPYEENGLLVLEDTKCFADCSLRPLLTAKINDLEKLKRSIAKNATRPEDQHRSKALHDLIRKRKAAMSEKMCRNLGDAIFAFFAPQTSTILTTNVRDHLPLAAALGKQVQSP